MASDRQGSNYKSCVWRGSVISALQEVLLVQFGLFVHKGDLKPHSFHFSSEHKLMKDDMDVIILVIFTAYLICM